MNVEKLTPYLKIIIPLFVSLIAWLVVQIQSVKDGQIQVADKVDSVLLQLRDSEQLEDSKYNSRFELLEYKLKSCGCSASKEKDITPIP